MQVRFLKFYQGQNQEYHRLTTHAATSVTDDGSGLFDIHFPDGTTLLGVVKTDVELYNGNVTPTLPPAGCCSKRDKSKK
jgi:hypothetical protein